MSRGARPSQEQSGPGQEDRDASWGQQSPPLRKRSPGHASSGLWKTQSVQNLPTSAGRRTGSSLTGGGLCSSHGGVVLTCCFLSALRPAPSSPAAPSRTQPPEARPRLQQEPPAGSPAPLGQEALLFLLPRRSAGVSLLHESHRQLQGQDVPFRLPGRRPPPA